jgi:hypothetical protein
MSAEPEVKPVEEAAPAPAADVVDEIKPSEPPTRVEEPAASPTPEKKAEATPTATATASASTPLSKLFAELPSIIKEADYSEIWGVTLTDETHIPSTIILEKFLCANDKDVAKAKAQLTEALKWRKKMEPLKLLEKEYDAAKFGDLGFVTVYDVKGKKEIVTWNIYGAVKDVKGTFGDVKEWVLPFYLP